MKNDYLTLLPGGETLMLDPTDGSETIAEAENIFDGYLDGDFANWNTNVKGDPTEAQIVQVYEMTEDHAFEQVYGSLGVDLNALCLSQAQIIQFVKKHREWFCNERHTIFFLFKVDEEFFVAVTSITFDGLLSVAIDRHSSGFIWSEGCTRRFVLPQLA